MRKRIYSIGILLVAFCAVLVFGLKTEGTNVSETADSTAASEEADSTAASEEADSTAASEEADTADGQADFGDICKEEPSDVQSQEIEKDGDYWLLKWRAEATIEYDGKTVPAKYSDEVIAVDYTDDLSMLECADRMNHYYAYRDGKVYYRQYHEDSFAQSGLWGNYAPVPGTEKEMVCIDQAGVKSELFQDKGCGAFYLIGERFYMMEVGNLYSVDMEGQDRIDYGMGEIIAVDEAEHIILLERIDEEYRSHYCVLDCETGACKSLSLQGMGLDEPGDALLFCAYQDRCVYLQKIDSTAKTTDLYAVSMEGEWQKVITLTPKAEHYYNDYIVHMEVCGDRLFFLYGGYDGSANLYQGGRIVTVKKDGSDYRSVQGPGDSEAYQADCFYLRQDAEKMLLYYPNKFIVDRGGGAYQYYDVTAWDIGADTFYPVEMPADVIGARNFYIDEENNVLALPDPSGRIVKAAAHLEDFIQVLPNEAVEDDLQLRFSQFYYKNGYFYFKAEYSVWSKEDCIGWRDGYRRVKTQHYRLKLGEDAAQKAELLYSY